MEYLLGDEKTNKKTSSKLILLLTISLALVVSPKVASASTVGDLQITNLAGNTTILTHDQVLALPQTTIQSALYCYGALVTDGNWTGVKLSEIINQVGLDQYVSSISFAASDGYKVAIPIETANQSDVIIAYEKDSAPLNEVYRLVVPYANGAVWIAMITTITMSIEGVQSPQSQTPALLDSLYNSRWQNPQPSIQPTPDPTTIQQVPTPNPTQTTQNQITPNPATPSINPIETTTQTQTFPFNALYAVAAGIVATLAIATLTIYKRKKA